MLVDAPADIIDEFKAFMASEEAFEFFIQGVAFDGIGYYNFQEDGRYWFSDSFWKMLGFEHPEDRPSIEDVQRMVNPADLRAGFLQGRDKLLNRSGPLDLTARFKGKGNRTITTRLLIFARYTGPMDMPRSVLFLITDKTEDAEMQARSNQQQALLKAMNDRLKRSEESLRLVFDHSPSRIWIKNDTNKIVQANRAAAHSVGREAVDLIGVPFDQCFPPSANVFLNDDREVFQSGKAVYDVEHVYAPASGSLGWASTDKIPLVLPDGETRILLISTDITEAKKKTSRLESLNRSLSEFASIMSHDLKAPARQISMFCDILDRHLTNDIGELSENTRMALDGLRMSTARMKDLIESLYALSLAETSPIPDVSFALDDAVEDALLVLQPDIEESQAVLERDVLPATRGNRVLMSQVFQNLLANSIKFAGPDTLKIEIRYTEDRIHGRHVIKVSDNGPGIAKTRAELVFEPFTRFEQGKQTEGLGLGLAISRRIVEAHGGMLSVDPDYNKGACFIISLPNG